MYMSEKITEKTMETVDINSELNGLLILFDRYVLKEKNGKFQFSGEIFEYHFACEVPAAELVTKIGEFLITIPKYMWNLKKQELQNTEN
nr:MAG TPA: hypothetical protein [Caudoviricetes sp.]DAQ65226.1 MAG TPA: hypothetical protein [Caudoviricetes sp.]